MILSSREGLLISASQHREFFMFDPKTTAVLHKYRTQEHLMPHMVYYQQAQQIVAQQVGKTFVSVWNWDAQEVDIKISLVEMMTAFSLSKDGHYLYGGSTTGTIYIWELPSGLLLKKKAVHASSILSILPFQANHLLTSSKTEVKVWSLSSFLIEEDNSPPLKQYTSVLDILAVAHTRNIIAILTHKNLTLLNGSLSHDQKELQVYQKIDYEFATAMVVSNTKVFVGDAKGSIELVELIPSEEEKLELHFGTQAGGMEISRVKKRRVLSSSKHPVTCLAFVESLAYLVSGHSNGQVIVWSNNEVKKALQLFKSSIACLVPLFKPNDRKVYQSNKIKPLHKYELGKDQEPLEIKAEVDLGDKSWSSDYELQISEKNEEEEILYRMMGQLCQPEKLLREELSSLRKERAQLLESNLHYFKMLVP